MSSHKLVKVSFRIRDEHLAEVDKLVQSNIYKDRSEVFNSAIIQMIGDIKFAKNRGGS